MFATHLKHEKTESKGNNISMNLKVNIWYTHLYSGEDNQFNSVLLKKIFLPYIIY